MTERGFRAFKLLVYGALAVNTALFLQAEGKLMAFLDSAAWIVLIGVMEYESTSLGERYAGRWEKILLVGLNLFAYSVILYALTGYVAAGDWIDVVNASAWLGVCAVLLYQMYVPGHYDRWEYRLIGLAKAGLYLVLLGCALVWSFSEDSLLDMIDAWLWLLCFATIELNVFGFESAAAEEIAAEEIAAEEAGGEVGAPARR